MLTLFIFYKSTDRIGYRQFRFGARRLTDVQPAYTGFLIDLKTSIGPGTSRLLQPCLRCMTVGGGKKSKVEGSQFQPSFSTDHSA